ncbi:putative membrane protein [Nocardioidaceae bacterium Broad-1]|nr:putative membrane protein [Nocardioidaceae bacterium Broad-1]
MSNPTRNGQVVDLDRPTNSPHRIAPPKLRRRPIHVVLALIGICLGAIGAAWAWSATTNTEEVLVARTTIERWSTIEASDIERVRISSDAALTPVPASDYNKIVGTRAAVDIAAGGLLTPESTTSDGFPPTGKSIVGVSLTAAQAPATALRGGDPVRVIVTPTEGSEAPAGAPQFTEAEVVSSHVDEASGQLVVNVLVPYADAPALAARAATGNVALVLDSAAQ